MKNHAAAILLIAVTLSLTGCGKTEIDGSMQSSTTVSNSKTQAIFANFYGEYPPVRKDGEDHIANMMFIAAENDPIWSDLTQVNPLGSQGISFSSFKVDKGEKADDKFIGSLILNFSLEENAAPLTNLELTIYGQKNQVKFGEITTSSPMSSNPPFSITENYPAMMAFCSEFDIQLENTSKDEIRIAEVRSSFGNDTGTLYSPVITSPLAPGEVQTIPLSFNCDVEDGSFYSLTPVVTVLDTGDKEHQVDLDMVLVGYMNMPQSRVDTVIASGNKVTVAP